MLTEHGLIGNRTAIAVLRAGEATKSEAESVQHPHHLAMEPIVLETRLRQKDVKHQIVVRRYINYICP